MRVSERKTGAHTLTRKNNLTVPCRKWKIKKKLSCVCKKTQHCQWKQRCHYIRPNVTYTFNNTTALKCCYSGVRLFPWQPALGLGSCRSGVTMRRIGRGRRGGRGRALPGGGEDVSIFGVPRFSRTRTCRVKFLGRNRRTFPPFFSVRFDGPRRRFRPVADFFPIF